MSRPRVLQIERLETRDLLSGSKVGAKLKQSAAPLVQSAAVPSITSFGVRTSADTSKSPTLNSTAIGQTKRWDTILIGTWYVPPANMLAYLVGPGVIDPVAVADETIFNITTTSGGVFSGTGSVQLTVPTPQGATTQPPTDFTIQGVVTPSGHIRIEFTLSSSQVTGIGNMEKVNHEWRMTMQLASSSSVKLFHWANMTKLPSNGTVPTPVVQPDGPLGQGAGCSARAGCLPIARARPANLKSTATAKVIFWAEDSMDRTFQFLPRSHPRAAYSSYWFRPTAPSRVPER